MFHDFIAALLKSLLPRAKVFHSPCGSLLARKGTVWTTKIYFLCEENFTVLLLLFYEDFHFRFVLVVGNCRTRPQMGPECLAEFLDRTSFGQ